MFRLLWSKFLEERERPSEDLYGEDVEIQVIHFVQSL